MLATQVADGFAGVASGMRLGIICDLAEENWLSMDLVGEMLLTHLRNGPPTGIEPEGIRPSMSRRFTTAEGSNSKFAFNVDRFLNRFWDYPRFLRRRRGAFDLFHLIDHSYAQLLLELPPGRTLVTCHDTETFRDLLEPAPKRSALFRTMVRRTLRGLRMAALVVCPSVATRDELLANNLVPNERLRVVPHGFHPSCSFQSDPAADLEAARLLGDPSTGETDLLHVGTTVPRKRIDVLIKVFAHIKKHFSKARLVHAGGLFTPAQESMLDELQLKDSVLVLPCLDRRTLAAVYRRAAAVLLPSEREGFGLPIVEAMACGTPVIASDLGALREAGGDCTVYCAVGDVRQWADAVSELLLERRDCPNRWQARRRRALAQASRFTWAQYTARMTSLYHEVLNGLKPISWESAS